MLRLLLGGPPASDHTAVWLGFLSSLVSSLAWPSAVLLIAFVFRKPLIILLGKVTKLSVGGVSLDIAQALDRAEELVVQEDVSGLNSDGDSPEIIQEVSDLPPEAVIMFEWRELELLLRRLGQTHLERRERISTSALIGALQRQAALPQNTAAILRDLVAIRNSVTHGETATPAEAIRFGILSRNIRKELEEILGAEN